MTELISIREAQEKILTGIKQTGIEICSVDESYGRVLAEDILSPLNLPAFENSSVDGFAVFSNDIANATPTSPIHLPVKMDIPAGFLTKAILATGSAARIFTGAPIPKGANAVVPVEDTDQYSNPQSISLPDFVAIISSVKSGGNIRPIGQDLTIGQLVLRKSRILQPQDIGLLMSLGIRQVQVMKKPRIALFSSGDELLAPDQSMTPGKIYDSNGYILTGILKSNGAEVIQLGIARDYPQSVMDTLDISLQNPPDLIIGSAGVSVGVFDFVRQVIMEHGSISFWKVNMRPGKPIAFGKYKDIPFLGLPGNPVSAYVGCIVFALPFIRHLLGLPPFTHKTIKAVLTEPIESPDGRESYLRGVIHQEDGVNKASLTGHQGSGNLFSLVQANGLIHIPAGVKMIPAGEDVDVWPLDSD